MTLELNRDDYEYYLYHSINLYSVTNAQGSMMCDSNSVVLASTKKMDGCYLLDRANIESVTGIPDIHRIAKEQVSKMRVFGTPEALEHVFIEAFKMFGYTINDVESSFKDGQNDVDVDDDEYSPMTPSDYAWNVAKSKKWEAKIDVIPCIDGECYYKDMNPKCNECHRGCRNIKPLLHNESFIKIISVKIK